MLKGNENFKERLRKSEEVTEKCKDIEEKLKDNTYFVTLLENRKKIKTLNEKHYALQVELNNLKNEIEKTEQEEGYQKGLQNWTTPITIDSYMHNYIENTYCNYNLDYWRLVSPLVDITIELKERIDLKVWKFEITSRIKNVKNRYAEDITTDVVKFKSKADALKLVEELKQELFNKYAEEFSELNKNIKLATEVRENFKGIERNFLPNELQFIIMKEYK